MAAGRAFRPDHDVMSLPTPAELQPWIEWRYDPASGPGGQNVNKVSTRATLLFDFHACALLSPFQRGRIATRLAGRLARDGRLQIVSQRERTQAGNRAAAERRLSELLGAALHVARARRPTHPTRASQRRRLQEKRLRGDRKRRRQGGGDDH
jgi:ribosome-associated protein